MTWLHPRRPSGPQGSPLRTWAAPPSLPVLELSVARVTQVFFLLLLPMPFRGWMVLSPWSRGTVFTVGFLGRAVVACDQICHTCSCTVAAGSGQRCLLSSCLGRSHPCNHRGWWVHGGGRSLGELAGALGPQNHRHGPGVCSRRRRVEWELGVWCEAQDQAGCGCGRAWPALCMHTCPLPAAQRHPGARGDVQRGVPGAPRPLHQHPRHLRPQQVVGLGGPGAVAKAPPGTQGLTPAPPTPQHRLPALPLPEAAPAHRAQGLPGAAAAAGRPADPGAGGHPRRAPLRAPASAPHRRGP